MPNPEVGLKALEALVKAASEQAGKAVPVAERYLPARLPKSMPELLRSARMEAELAGSKAGQLYGVESEMPMVQRFIRWLGKKKASHFEPSERPEIKSAVNLGAGEAAGGFDFFAPRQLPLEKAIKSKAGREVARTVPTMGLIPKSEELQQTLSRIGKVINEHQVKFGEMPSDRFIARRLNTKFGLKIEPEAVQRLRAGIVPPGGPFAEAGQLPTSELRLDAPDLSGKGTIGEHVPESIKESPGGAGGEKADLSGAIEALTDKQRKALMDYFVGGKTQSEIAKELGISQKNVNKLIGKGVAHIRTSVKRPPVSGASGEFPGISTSAIFRSPQRSATEGVLPPLADLYEFMKYRGQPSFRTQLLAHRAGLGPIQGPPSKVVEAASEGMLPEMQRFGTRIGKDLRPAGQGAKAAERSNPALQLRELQDLMTRLFMTSSRQ